MTSKPVANASKPTTVHSTMTKAGGGAAPEMHGEACPAGPTQDGGSDPTCGGVKTDKGI